MLLSHAPGRAHCLQDDGPVQMSVAGASAALPAPGGTAVEAAAAAAVAALDVVAVALDAVVVEAVLATAAVEVAAVAVTAFAAPTAVVPAAAAAIAAVPVLPDTLPAVALEFGKFADVESAVAVGGDDHSLPLDEHVHHSCQSTSQPLHEEGWLQQNCGMLGRESKQGS